MSTLVVAQTLDYVIKSDITNAEKREFSGFATLESVDDVRDTIDPNDVNRLFEDYYKYPVVLLYHDKKRPVGLITKHLVDRKDGVLGVRVWGNIGKSKDPGADTEIAWELMEQGILKGLSVRIKPESFRYLTGGVRKIIPKKLREISLTPLGAHSDTLVDTIVKSLEFKEMTEDSKMEDAKLEQLLKESLGGLKEDISKSLTELDTKFSKQLEKVRKDAGVEEPSEIMKSLESEEVQEYINKVVDERVKGSKQIATLTKALGIVPTDDGDGDDEASEPVTQRSGFERYQEAIKQ